MVFRFLILSDETDDFVREIKIDAEATFLDLHNAILDSVNFTKDQMSSFFICDDDWSKKNRNYNWLIWTDLLKRTLMSWKIPTGRVAGR